MLTTVYLIPFIRSICIGIKKDKYFLGFSFLLLFQLFFIAVPYAFMTITLLLALLRKSSLLAKRSSVKIQDSRWSNEKNGQEHNKLVVSRGGTKGRFMRSVDKR